jgi:hypothetical protein
MRLSQVCFQHLGDPWDNCSQFKMSHHSGRPARVLAFAIKDLRDFEQLPGWDS